MNFIRDAEDALLVLFNDTLDVPVIVDYDDGPEPVSI